ncbi:MAG: hypothetical protein WA738_12890 [Candidatus Angelobacter sp.]
MSLRSTTLFLAAACSFIGLAAQQPPPAPPQTPRQALLEMITGGQQAAMRHLTVEMQKSLQDDSKNGSFQMLASFDQMKSAASEFQVFETGQVLLAANEAGSKEKFEVHVDSDDLSGDTDNMDLSFHQFRDGIEQDIPYTAMLSRFTIGLKRQENVWRLNDISVNIRVPVGDPAMLKKVGENGFPGMFGAKIGGVSSDKASVPPDMSIEQTFMMLAFAESSYAMAHPETGFSCNMTDLAQFKHFNIDSRIFSGEAYHGYKFSLSTCQGKPAESFHLVAEPVSPAAGAKAYCTDATRNVRTSDDGRGSTCLISGKSSHSGGAGDTHTVFMPAQK